MVTVKVEAAPLKYQQIRVSLAKAIRGGTYQVGDKLPSESELAESFSASRSTVIRALAAIEEEGLIRRRQGSGSFITELASTPQRLETVYGVLRATQSGRFADSVADQVQNRLSAIMQRRGSALISHSIEKGADPLAVARNLLEKNIGGVFMVPLMPDFSTAANTDVAALFRRSGRPVVLLDGDTVAPPHRSDFDMVGIENRHCGYLQTAYLLDLGLRRILYVGSDPAVPTVTERHLGYCDAMRERGVDVPAEWTLNVSSDQIDAALIDDVIRRHRPEGIVFKSDEFAALFMRHLSASGVRVPQDLKIVGFDDRPIASLLPVTLTTIRQPIEELAESAIQLMDSRLANARRAAGRVLLAGTLIARQSTAV